jgi:PAS domain S-box-containing protein
MAAAPDASSPADSNGDATTGPAAQLGVVQSANQRLRRRVQRLRKALERALSDRTRYQRLFEFAPAAYVITNVNGIIREANVAFTRLVDRRLEHLVGMPLPFLAAPASRYDFYNLLRRARPVPAIQSLELLVLPLTGQEKLVKVTVAPMFEEPGEASKGSRNGSGLTGYCWLFRDQTVLRQAEQGYLREKNLSDTLLETIPAIVLVTDVDGLIHRSGSYMQGVSWKDPETIPRQLWQDVFVPEPERATGLGWKALRQVLQTGRIDNRVFDLDDGRGGQRTFSWSARLLPGLDGPGRIVWLGIDITELRDAQERALQAGRLAGVGQMVSGLAHESRNALQRSAACLELINLACADRPEVLNLVARVQQAQADLHTLLEEVRAYAAPIRLALSWCHLPQIWREAWADLHLLRQGRKTELREELDNAHLDCPVSPFHLKQVFRNLLENSLAAGADRVVVTTRLTDGDPATLQIALRDNGPGVAAKDQACIFEPFFTTKVRGTGLGLAICRRILEAHGGQITLNADTGSGAEFILELPAPWKHGHDTDHA